MAARRRRGDDRKSEYDFSNAECGRFYGKNAALDLPVYLEASMSDYLAERAKAKGVDINDLLRRDIELFETAK